MEKPYKIKVSISLDENVIERIKELAEEYDRNFSQYINMILKIHIYPLQITKSLTKLQTGEEYTVFVCAREDMLLTHQV